MVMARILTNKKLCEAIEYSRRKLEPFRRQRTSAVKQYVGAHYTDESAPERMPVNSPKGDDSIQVFGKQAAGVGSRNRHEQGSERNAV